MSQNLSSALILLITGTITVFLILWLLVIIGGLIIRLTNKYLPVPEAVVKAGDNLKSVPAGTLAAIVAAVEIVTGGKGKVDKIEKESI